MSKRKVRTKEELEEAVKGSYSWSEAMRKVGLNPTGGNHRSFQHKVRFFGIDFSHFTGQGWAKGKTSFTDDRIEKIAEKTRRPDSEVFVENSPVIGGHNLKGRLKRLGVKYACSCCGIYEWNGNPLTLHLDHINGISNDNRIFNLRYLCPNCHQQTTTWGNKKNKKKTSAFPDIVFLNDIDDNPELKFPKISKREDRNCGKCGKQFSVREKSTQRFCSYECATLSSRKWNIDDSELAIIVWEKPVSLIAKQCGVSDNAIAHRCKKLGIKTPGRGYWAKIRALGETEAAEVLDTSV